MTPREAGLFIDGFYGLIIPAAALIFMHSSLAMIRWAPKSDHVETQVIYYEREPHYSICILFSFAIYGWLFTFQPAWIAPVYFIGISFLSGYYWSSGGPEMTDMRISDSRRLIKPMIYAGAAAAAGLWLVGARALRWI
jgi:hypothetical protein